MHYKKARNTLLWDTNTVQNTLSNVKLPLKDYIKPDGVKELLSRILCYGFGIVTGVSIVFIVTKTGYE